ncbi:unnamed protein product [Timema podura]|uniref:Uncharacterized protein n=1 Tax=Timema podura TaxID=61482 RepID=A0ABN7NC03_TIMPD|nr:unnamed protein product [Timema podura]
MIVLAVDSFKHEEGRQDEKDYFSIPTYMCNSNNNNILHKQVENRNKSSINTSHLKRTMCCELLVVVSARQNRERENIILNCVDLVLRVSSEINKELYRCQFYNSESNKQDDNCAYREWHGRRDKLRYHVSNKHPQRKPRSKDQGSIASFSKQIGSRDLSTYAVSARWNYNSALFSMRRKLQNHIVKKEHKTVGVRVARAAYSAVNKGGGSDPAFAWRESGKPFSKNHPLVHLTEIRTSISLSSAVELNTTSVLNRQCGSVIKFKL